MYITTGDEQSSDALSIAPYAADKQIPILLTSKHKLDAEVTQFLAKHQVQKATIIGGTDALSSAVEKGIKAKCEYSRTCLW
nr:cell wall-binding repeat-containing protein [Sediminibacillus albus]